MRVVQNVYGADVRDEPKVSMDDVWARLDRDYAVGYDDVKATLREIQDSVEYQRRQSDGLVTPESYNFAIQGPPGTGKTVFARDILGPFFCALDIIPSKDVVEKSAGDLTAQYVGQTAYLVRKHFGEGWGKVIFFDEISGICNSVFGDEAVTELLPTLENNPSKFVFVVADYAHNIDRFFAMNGGLHSRIKYRITLKPWDVETSLHALLTKMAMPAADKGYGLDLRGHEGLLRELLDTLVRVSYVDASGKYSGFSSGRTVCLLLASVIFKKYTSTHPAANAPVSEAVLRVAFAEVQAQLQEAVDGDDEENEPPFLNFPSPHHNAAKITQKWPKSTARHKIGKNHHSKKIFIRKKSHGTMQWKKSPISGQKIPKK